MNSNNNMIELQMELPIEHEKKVFGQFDEHIKILERSLAVTLISRDGVLKIVGPASNAARAKECLTQLLELSRRGNDITTQNVNYAISLVMEDSGSSLAEIDSDCICHTVAGRPVKPKTLGQKAYVDAIREKMVVFGVGPAGTGKTYLAMARNSVSCQEICRAKSTRICGRSTTRCIRSWEQRASRKTWKKA